MPVSSRTCANAGQICESFESSYRSETSSKKFSTFLKRPLIVHSRINGEYARFSLIELLKHLNIPQALLKGSTVYNWKSEQASADIDLQIFSEPEGTQHHTEKIIEFLKSRSNCRNADMQLLHEKTWLSKVAQQFKKTWHRTIISVGYIHPQGTTLDLNFTNNRTVAHDTIHASKAIQFNWIQPKAFIIDSWHPHLVQWLSKNQLLWFNPDIEDGLMRLSYRLSKLPDAFLLQADLPAHFCEQASESNLRSICLRVMMNEYSRNQLTPSERRLLWEPVIDTAKQTENEALKRDLLAWSKFNNLAHLKDALTNPDTRQTVLNRLTTGCQIGADFNNAVKHALKTNPEISNRLKPMIGTALGGTLVPGKLLFKQLDTWPQIQEVPEHELQTVFTECLNKLTQCSDQHTSDRAHNMLGWLNGDDLATLKFWADRIPDTLRNDPPSELIEPVLDAVLQLIQTQGVDSLAPALPQLGQLRIGQSDWHTLARALMSTQPASTHAKGENTDDLTLQFMRLLASNSPLLSAFVPGSKVDLEGTNTPMPTQQFYSQIMAFVDCIHTQKIPPILKSILYINRNEVEIKLPDLLLTVSQTHRTAAAVIGPVKHWVNESSYAVFQPISTGAGHALQVMWRDGSLFSGQQTTDGNFNFNGFLSQICKPGTSTDLNGLLQAGRLLANNLFSGSDPQHSHWTCHGLFNGQQMLKADHLGQAVLTMKQGVIREQSHGSGFLIEHHFKNYKPDHCKVIAHTARSSVELKMTYRPETDVSATASVFSNPWHAEPELSNIQSICRLNSPPYGELQFTTILPWNDLGKSLSGQGEVTVKGSVTLRWVGQVASGKLLPIGKLFLDRQKEPVIKFDSDTSSASIPMTLLPVMAELLGKHSNGTYPYTPKVWDEPNQWPGKGFEGFVNLLPCGNNLFSGYLTSTGQAVGVVSQMAPTHSDFYTAWTGSFLVQPATVLNQQLQALDPHSGQPFSMQLSNGKTLLPHGVVYEHTMSRFNSQPPAKKGQIYFCGENIPYQRITQNDTIQYNSPGLTRYFVGLNYAHHKQMSQLDVVFNPGDGGYDFMFIRPERYETLTNFQEIYRDSQGMRANWLIANRHYQMGQIKFPSGIEYSGQISQQNNQFNLQGKGKFTLGSLSFTGVFGADATIQNLKGLNPESEHWVSEYCGTAKNRAFQLDEWLEIISGGQFNWEADMKAHLRCRNLGALKNNATVFSRT